MARSRPGFLTSNSYYFTILLNTFLFDSKKQALLFYHLNRAVKI
ncbi:hypothetical protein LEP1GSC059_3542 [Leptospira noguchii serovar Panama str. CZ214]|uniref:Uncharacterized protein n=1 Tax=Leptospira noguchii serovar Panama str. CZ214 TaxID=1001595 RepID=T0GU53_9LEPT|nr:hypothetical protein LEP1GSC059_3542 [Leptospira noguchii serovar Panama str. CZ214]